MSGTDLLLLITLSVWKTIKPQTHQLFLSIKLKKETFFLPFDGHIDLSGHLMQHSRAWQGAGYSI